MTHSVEYGQPGERTTQTGFEMPAPTLLPLALAFGLMLAFLGLIFHLYLVYVGVAVAFSAAIGWWRAVIPAEAHEQVALDPAHRPSPVLMRPEAVIRLKPGESLHRVHLPHEAHSYSSGIIGGLAGCFSLHLWPHRAAQHLVSCESARRSGIAVHGQRDAGTIARL